MIAQDRLVYTEVLKLCFPNMMFFNLMFVHVVLAGTFSINRSNCAMDFRVAADQAITNYEGANEVRLIKMYKNSDVCTNVVGFHAFLERSLQRKVLEYTLNPLTNVGFNFGAVVQALEVKLIDCNNSNQVETLHLVSILTIPKKNLPYNLSQFPREIHFFSDIVPAIQHFEEIENVPQIDRISNAFPRYFGSRLSLNSSATIGDSNAVLLLENLQFSNYISKDQKSRHNRNNTMATLKVLAKIHAMGISIRQKQPTIFNSKIGPYLKSVVNIVDYKNIIDEVRSVFIDVYSENVLAEIEKQTQPGVEYYLKTDPDDHTPYTTICHRDFWITNVMFKNEKSGVDGAIQVKLLDFAKCRYESFANDLIFFLLTSAPLDDLQTNFRSFIEYYHIGFTQTLKNLNISLDDYTYDKMWHEIKQTAQVHLIRVLKQIKAQSMTYDGSTSKIGAEVLNYLIEQPASDIVLLQWRGIIDLFIENEFINLAKGKRQLIHD